MPSRPHDLTQKLSQFPWRNTARVLRQRFSEERLDLTAGSLTYTTVLSIVPLFTVILSVFTAFPMFGKLQGSIQNWLMESLIPENIAQTVMQYLGQFSSSASRLGAVSLMFLAVTSISLILTMDRTLNNIWRVRKLRPLGQRILIYFAALTLGPLLLALSLSLTSYAISASSGLVQAMPQWLRMTFGSAQFFMMGLGMGCLFHYVPNTRVQWRHAMAGGYLVASGLWLAKKLLAMYLTAVPTYSAIYGTFATLPILLLWIYLVWIIILLGATIAAYLPGLRTGTRRPANSAGWQFQLALEIIQQLHDAPDNATGARTRTLTQICQALHVEDLQAHNVLEALEEIGWVGQLAPLTESGHEDVRYALLAQGSASLQPLVEKLLLAHSREAEHLCGQEPWGHLCLRNVLEPCANAKNKG